MYLACTLADTKIFISQWIVFTVFQWYAVWQEHTRAYVQPQAAQMLCMSTLKWWLIQHLLSPKTIEAFRLLAQLAEGNQFCRFWNSLGFLYILHCPESYQEERFLSVSFRSKHGSQLPLNSLESEVRNFIWAPRPLFHGLNKCSVTDEYKTDYCWKYTQLPKLNAAQLTINTSPKANCHISRSSKVVRPFTIAPSGVSQRFYSYDKCSRLKKLVHRY